MQIHPLVTVKKAAAVLGMDKNIIREKLASGEYKGERRYVGDKEKWFLYAGEVNSLLENKLVHGGAERTERVSVDGMEAVFDGSPTADSATMEFDPGEDAHQFTTAELDSGDLFTWSAHDYSARLTPSATGIPPFDFTSNADALLAYSDMHTQTPATNPSQQFTSTEEAVTAFCDFTLAQTIPAVYSGEVIEELPIADGEPVYRYASQSTALAEPIPEMDEILQALTIEFANRLAEERQTIIRLEQQLAEREQLARQLPDLQATLYEEQTNQRSKDTEIKSLRIQVALLESRLEHVRLPWWKRLFKSPLST